MPKVNVHSSYRVTLTTVHIHKRGEPFCAANVWYEGFVTERDEHGFSMEVQETNDKKGEIAGGRSISLTWTTPMLVAAIPDKM